MLGEDKAMIDVYDIIALAILVGGVVLTGRGSISINRTPRSSADGGGRGAPVDTLDEVFEGAEDDEDTNSNPDPYDQETRWKKGDLGYNPASGLPTIPCTGIDVQGNPVGTNSDY